MIYLIGSIIVLGTNSTILVGYLGCLARVSEIGMYDLGEVAYGTLLHYMAQYSQGKQRLGGYLLVWDVRIFLSTFTVLLFVSLLSHAHVVWTSRRLAWGILWRRLTPIYSVGPHQISIDFQAIRQSTFPRLRHRLKTITPEEVNTIQIAHIFPKFKRILAHHTCF